MGVDFIGWSHWDWSPPSFDPDGFRGQSQSQGHSYRWEKAMKCPCQIIAHENEAPLGTDYVTPMKEGRPDCPDCHGSGYLYFGGQTINALHHNASTLPRWLMVHGSLLTGACGITTQPEHILNRRDRLIDLDEVRIYDETLVRTGATDQPTYPIVTEQIPTGQADDPTIPATQQRGVIYMRRADSAGNITDDELVEGTDFNITADGLIEWIDAGTRASGSVYLAFTTDEVSEGDIIPAGFVFTSLNTGVSYATDFAAIATSSGPGSLVIAVSVTALSVGADGNVAADDDFGFIAETAPTSGIVRMNLGAITGGTDPGDGGNVPAVGDRYALQYVCRPTYIVRLLPHMGRTARVQAEPYINTIGGFKGYWSPDEGAFPSGVGVVVGDYWEVSASGTFAGLTWTYNDVLLALVDEPVDSYAGNWKRLSDDPTPSGETEVAHMPMLAVCWLEDLGDPFQRAGTP